MRTMPDESGYGGRGEEGWDADSARHILRISMTAELGSRICVIGPPGAGKSTLAKLLARRLGLQYIDRDAALSLPRRQQVGRGGRRAIFEPLTAGDRWTFDGHRRPYVEDESLVWDRFDTIIWLDFTWWEAWRSLLAHAGPHCPSRTRLVTARRASSRGATRSGGVACRGCVRSMRRSSVSPPMPAEA